MKTMKRNWKRYTLNCISQLRVESGKAPSGVWVSMNLFVLQELLLIVQQLKTITMRIGCVVASRQAEHIACSQNFPLLLLKDPLVCVWLDWTSLWPALLIRSCLAIKLLMRHMQVQLVVLKRWMPPSLHLDCKDRGNPVWRKDAFRGTWYADTELFSLFVERQFMGQAYNAFIEVLSHCEDGKCAELSVSMQILWKQSLNNCNRSYTITLRYPGHHHYYISIRSVLFRNFFSS